jgi:single-strand DNA-binding protein
MAKGTVNKVILVGRLGSAIELHHLPTGTAVANISIATNEDYKDATTGQLIDRTQWHRVVVFGKLAETMQQYLHKGDLVYIDGRIRTTKYQDKTTGQDRYATDIIVNEMQMLGGKADQSSPMPDYVPAHIDVSLSNARLSQQSSSE